MKVKIEIDCTPEEARAFLGLPDVSGLSQRLTEEIAKRMDGNIAALRPEELMKTWNTFGAQAQEQFRKLMAASVDIPTRSGD
jgi:hypothetical protein